jgi:hypothetical protein
MADNMIDVGRNDISESLAAKHRDEPQRLFEVIVIDVQGARRFSGQQVQPTNVALEIVQRVARLLARNANCVSI